VPANALLNTGYLSPVVHVHPAPEPKKKDYDPVSFGNKTISFFEVKRIFVFSPADFQVVMEELFPMT